MDFPVIMENVQAVSAQFALERGERQLRRELHAADFDQLREAGLYLTGVLAEHGGLWESVSLSTRPICDLLRILAHGDSSVALVCAMHPSVLSFWLATREASPASQSAWEEQRNHCSQTAYAGAWWGTITSEPGSGGDISQTKATARPDAATGYRITGIKHFGSGSGITSFMITTAVPTGESNPDIFVLDMRGVPWDSSTGVKLTAPWDGHGMTATQSHGMSFEDLKISRRSVSLGAETFAKLQKHPMRLSPAVLPPSLSALSRPPLMPLSNNWKSVIPHCGHMNR
jgi:alkylation response protein AidB-like acyl-CoA dehydrogenase